MSVDTVLVPDFPHGTHEGFNRGCRGGGTCLNRGSETLMTCREAHIRYAGDARYRAAVLGGTATAKREEFTKPKRVRERKPAPAPQPVKAPEEQVPVGFTHGKASGYDKHGCRLYDDCPAVAEGGISCRAASLKSQRERRHRRLKEQAEGIFVAEFEHGTLTGYRNHGCRLRDDCPGKATAGRSCREAHNAYQRDNYVSGSRSRKRAAA